MIESFSRHGWLASSGTTALWTFLFSFTSHRTFTTSNRAISLRLLLPRVISYRKIRLLGRTAFSWRLTTFFDVLPNFRKFLFLSRSQTWSFIFCEYLWWFINNFSLNLFFVISYFLRTIAQLLSSPFFRKSFFRLATFLRSNFDVNLLLFGSIACFTVTNCDLLIWSLFRNFLFTFLWFT